jgi:hypothetical protein
MRPSAANIAALLDTSPPARRSTTIDSAAANRFAYHERNYETSSSPIRRMPCAKVKPIHVKACVYLEELR